VRAGASQRATPPAVVPAGVGVDGGTVTVVVIVTEEPVGAREAELEGSVPVQPARSASARTRPPVRPIMAGQ